MFFCFGGKWWFSNFQHVVILFPSSALEQFDFFSTLGLLGLRPRTWRQWKAVHRRGGESRGEGAERAQWVDNHVTQVLRPLTTGVPLVESNGGEGGDWHKWMHISQGWAGILGNESLWVPFPKFGNRFVSLPSRSWILEMEFPISVPAHPWHFPALLFHAFALDPEQNKYKWQIYILGGCRESKQGLATTGQPVSLKLNIAWESCLWI